MEKPRPALLRPKSQQGHRNQCELIITALFPEEPGTVPSIFHALFYLILTTVSHGKSCLIPTLQIRRQNHREMKELS
jgi:hypothetical protein